MAIKLLAMLMCVLPLAVSAADNPSKPASNNNPAPAARAMPPNPISSPTAEDAGKAIFELSGLVAQVDTISQPLLEPNHPFKEWVTSAKSQMHKAFDSTKAAPSPAEILTQAKALKSKVQTMIAIIQQMTKIDAETYKIMQEAEQTKACLKKRAVTLQEADVAYNSAIKQLLFGWIPDLKPATGLINDAQAACP